MLSHFSRVQLFVTLWTVACQAPLSMGFSRQGYWSGLPCPPPGDLPDPGIHPCLLCLLHWGLTGFPDGASGKEPACQCRRCRRPRFHPWVGKIPWERKWHTIPVFLPGESHGQRSLVGYSPWGRKEWDTTEHTYTSICVCVYIYTHE